MTKRSTVRRGIGRPRQPPGTTRLLPILLAAMLAAPQAVAAQRAPTHGALQGRVLDVLTNQGVADAFVEFLDGSGRARGSAVTDNDGGFLLVRMPAGPFSLRVFRLGFAEATTPYWRVRAGETLTVTVRLHPSTIVLAPLEINARAHSASPVLAGFYRRMERRLGGTYFNREDIERRMPQRITDLLVDVPGVRLEDGVVKFGRSPFAARGGECAVQIFIDGMLARGGPRGSDPLSPNEFASPSDLEGVEVYRGMGTIPPEFLTPEARCGVIALWTRRGG